MKTFFVGLAAIDPRANIGDRLALRNMLDQLRGGGYIGGGPNAFAQRPPGLC